MHPLIQLKTTPQLLITLALLCFELSPGAQAVVPAPDGGYGPPAYGAGNTAEGENSLLELTSGPYNTAVGWSSLESVTTGSLNTGVGAGTLAAIWAGVTLAVLMKCEECGRRPTVVWDLKALRAGPRSEWRALRDHFYPPDLRSGNFQCAHCKTRFQLRAPRT